MLGADSSLAQNAEVTTRTVHSPQEPVRESTLSYGIIHVCDTFAWRQTPPRQRGAFGTLHVRSTYRTTRVWPLWLLPSLLLSENAISRLLALCAVGVNFFVPR